MKDCKSCIHAVYHPSGAFVCCRKNNNRAKTFHTLVKGCPEHAAGRIITGRKPFTLL